MSEPNAAASRIERVVAGVWRWHVWDDRIDFESAAYAVADGARKVLIDPLPLRPAALKALGPVSAICLTAACHQRSAWRYRKMFGVEVYAPRGASGTEEKPDASYRPGDVLPGGLEAVRTPGPEYVHFAFLRRARPGVLFSADLLKRVGASLAFIPPEYHDDPKATRRSVQRLLDLPFSVLCLAHGAPIKRNAHAALRQLLER